MTSVLCLGIAVQDYVFGVNVLPVAAEKYLANAFANVGGGMAANAAVAIARLGGQAALAARLGDDEIGRSIVADLEGEGVDCRLVRRVRGRGSPVSAVMVDAAGERMIINYTDADLPDDPDWLPERLPSETRVALSDTRWEAGARRLFALARTASVSAVLDGDRAPKHRELLAEATHLVMSASAARNITGRDDLTAALIDFPAPPHVHVAITDGARGTYLRDGARVAIVPAFSVKAVDTLAAGDVFHGAFAYGLSESMDNIAALRFASAAAAIKCTRFGGRKGAPRRDEVEQFLKGAA